MFDVLCAAVAHVAVMEQSDTRTFCSSGLAFGHGGLLSRATDMERIVGLSRDDVVTYRHTSKPVLRSVSHRIWRPESMHAGPFATLMTIPGANE